MSNAKCSISFHSEVALIFQHITYKQAEQDTNCNRNKDGGNTEIYGEIWK